ncbi:hypothetical protein [Allokutzneria oryzae]|uniref:Polyketide cyclase n=1 Tax=Allokutzneria oryzae TaxID=1378989 RepID=A0ABV5ZSM1_9PSEU
MPESTEVFRFRWHGSHYPGSPVEELWFAIERDQRGTWWFDAYVLGRVRLSGGAPHVARFARWLLEPPPQERYESEFLLVDDEPQPGRAISWLARGATEPERIDTIELTVEVLLGREGEGGPEFLQLAPAGHAPEHGIAFQVCAELEWDPMDRTTLERTATALLTATST